MLGWCNRFSICCFLDNHHYNPARRTVECLAAVGAVEVFTAGENILQQLDHFIQRHHKDWLFAHFGYDLKNEIESLASSHPDHIGFPDACFFVPEIVLQLTETELVVSSATLSPAAIFQAIRRFVPIPEKQATPVYTQPRIQKADYLATIQQLRQHIHRGDCYEINFCQEFFAGRVSIDPLQLYNRLTILSPNPFACFYRLNDKYLLCASPERFLQKKGNRLCSQPIKGTIKRDLADKAADAALMKHLRESEKDKSENVMVVDLVRNDLSRVCKEGSVAVDELFGIYSFPQVHQMISTISGELREGISFTDILKACFPMGSMTGAPKKRVMELIEQYEQTRRGLYSGAVGYINPEGDFDFNVVIRSILYNATAQYLGYQVGGGITFYSDPEKEYAECLLKAEAIRKVLEITG